MRVRFVVVTGAIAALLVNVVSPWVDHRWRLTDPKHIAYTLAAFVAMIALEIALNSGVRLPGYLAFHRYKYLHELTRSKPLSQWRTRFSPLQLGRGPRYIASAEVIAEGERRDLIDLLSDALTGKQRGASRVLILGEPGCGKTTAMERLTLELARHSLRRLGFSGSIPILVRAGDHRRADDLQTIISDSIAKWAKRKTSAVLTDPAVIQRLLDGRRFVILVDALDELSGDRRSAVLEALATPSRAGRFSDLPIIATCRTRQDPENALPDYQTYSVLDLSEEAVASFVAIHAAETRLNPGETYLKLRDGGFLESAALGRNPFWLLALISAGTQHRSRSQILGAATRQKLAAELDKPAGSTRKWTLPVPKDEQIEVSILALARLAEEMQANQPLAKTTVLALLHRWQAARSEQLGSRSILPDQIVELCRDAGLLARTNDPISFSHRLIQEYFAALSLYENRQSLGTRLEEYVQDPNRWQSLAMFIGLLTPVEQVDRVRSILSGGTSPGRLACAIAACVGDGWLAAGSMAPVLLELLSSNLTGDGEIDPQLRESVRQLLITGHNVGAGFIGRLLMNPSPNVRKGACCLLALSSAPEAVRLLVFAGLDDPDPDVASDVCSIVKETGEAAVWPLIRQLFAESEAIRERAAKALENLEAPDAVNFLLECDVDTDVAGQALVKCGARRVGRLLLALATEGAMQRERAVIALSGNSDPRVLDAIERAIGDENSAVRRRAVRAFRTICDRTADSGLAEQRRTVFVAALERVLKEQGADDGGHVLEELATLHAEAATKALIETVSHTPALHHPVVEQLKAMGDSPAVRKVMIQALSHKKEDVRRAAVEVLDECEGPTVTRALIGSLGDDSRPVRERAMNALVRRDSDEVYELLAEALRFSSPTARPGIIAVFSRLPKRADPRALQSLIVAASDPDQNVRSAVTLALRSFETPEANEALARLAVDTSPQVRIAAIRELSRTVSSAFPRAVESGRNPFDEILFSGPIESERVGDGRNETSQ